MKKPRSQDLRVIKTERTIQKAFVSLLQEKEFSKITVRDICNRAMVNPNTFYNHFTDKYDLANQINQKILENFSGALMEAKSSCSSEDYSITVSKAYNALYLERDAALGMWNVQVEDVHLRRSMIELFQQQYQAIFSDAAEDDASLEYQSFLYASVAVSSIYYLLTKDTKKYILSPWIELQKMVSNLKELSSPKLKKDNQ